MTRRNGRPVLSDEEAFSESSRRIALSRSDAGEFLVRLGARYNLNRLATLEMVSDVVEEFLPARPAGGERRIREMTDCLNRVCSFLETLKLMPTDCLIFLLRNGRLLGCESQRDIVKRHAKDPEAKANVSKWMKKIQRQTGLQPAPGMRADVKAMRRARKEQLQPPARTEA